MEDFDSSTGSHVPQMPKTTGLTRVASDDFAAQLDRMLKENPLPVRVPSPVEVRVRVSGVRIRVTILSWL